VTGDSLRLEQVLQNLISNAVKYSPAGGPVRVAVSADARHACLRVQDQGIGVPETALPHLFGRFYRAPNVDSHAIAGLGIGLYVVAQIVELHQGTIAVESTEGGGSTFTICLPVRAASGTG
jgi:signal transduction histidine kinase